MDDDDKLPNRYAAELAEFFSACAPWLFGHACVITRRDSELADDLVQDTFEAAAKAWGTVRGLMPNQQRAWLRTTLSNIAVSGFRRSEAFRRKQATIRPAETEIHAQALSAIVLRRTWEIIEILPERQHVIALMRWREGMKASEIAAELGIAEGTVGAHIHSIRKKLIAELGPYYPFGRDDAEGEAS